MVMSSDADASLPDFFENATVVMDSVCPCSMKEMLSCSRDIIEMVPSSHAEAKYFPSAEQAVDVMFSVCVLWIVRTRRPVVWSQTLCIMSAFVITSNEDAGHVVIIVMGCENSVGWEPRRRASRSQI